MPTTSKRQGRKKTSKLRLFGHNWKLIEHIDNTKESGGSFGWRDKTIRINDRYGERKAILLHEIIEAVMLQNLARFYANEGNAEYHFFFNHTQFCKIVLDIYQALEDNKLLK